MSKRKLKEFDEDLAQNQARKSVRVAEGDKKHTLDSDEEDEEDERNVLDDDDIEG